MFRLSGHGAHSPSDTPHQPSGLYERWAEQYGLAISAQLQADRRYMLVRIGSVEFAYTDHGHYLRALGQAWQGGFVPDPLPSSLGSELLEVAPHLQGVDSDLADLTPADVAEPRRRLSWRRGG
jgi:hypothetical protein